MTKCQKRTLKLFIRKWKKLGFKRAVYESTPYEVAIATAWIEAKKV